MKLMRIDETAEVMRVTSRTAQKWLRQGLIPGTKLAGKWTVDFDTLRETMRSRVLANIHRTPCARPSDGLEPGARISPRGADGAES